MFNSTNTWVIPQSSRRGEIQGSWNCFLSDVYWAKYTNDVNVILKLISKWSCQLLLQMNLAVAISLSLSSLSLPLSLPHFSLCLCLCLSTCSICLSVSLTFSVERRMCLCVCGGGSLCRYQRKYIKNTDDPPPHTYTHSARARVFIRSRYHDRNNNNNNNNWHFWRPISREPRAYKKIEDWRKRGMGRHSEQKNPFTQLHHQLQTYYANILSYSPVSYTHLTLPTRRTV